MVDFFQSFARNKLYQYFLDIFLIAIIKSSSSNEIDFTDIKWMQSHYYNKISKN